MKIVFFGSSDFAVPSLERLLDSTHKVAAVITQPDREKGRHLKVSVTPVKKVATCESVKILQPEDIRDRSFLVSLRSLSADLFVVAAFGQILPRKVLEMPKLYSINLHASFLPKYRGAAPVNWAIIKGETKTGLTIIRMNEKVDAGDILLQRKVEIEKEETAWALNKKLSELGALLLLDAIRLIKEERIKFKKQNEKQATLAPKLKKEDGLIDWNVSALEIHNKVRGTVPWPGGYTYFDNKKINIWKTSVLSGKANPGEIVEARNELVIGSKRGLLKIEEIQIEGKRRMPAADFLRGHENIKKGAALNITGQINTSA